MENLKYAVGIDVSKDDFKACLSLINHRQKVTVKSSKTFSNTAKGFMAFAQWYTRHQKEDLPMFFLLEATGAYHEPLAWFLHKKGLNISIILPDKAKNYLKSLGIKSKTDKIDAQGLAQMCAEKCLDLWQPLSEERYQIRTLTRLHEDLQAQRTVLKNQLHAQSLGMYSHKTAELSLKRQLKHTEKEWCKLEDEITKVVNNDDRLRDKFQKLSLIKGVGILTFATIVAATDGFTLF